MDRFDCLLVVGRRGTDSREGEREGGLRRSTTGQDRTQVRQEETGLETPAVRRLCAGLGSSGLGMAAAEKKGSARFCSAAGGRKRRSSQVPRAPRGGVGWAAHGGCLGGWVRCWWAYVDSVGFALLSAPPWSPGRGSTGCVQMLPPAHLGTHTWAPSRLGCFNGPVGLAAWTRVQQQTGRRLGTVVQVLYQTWCTQPMVGWKPWK